MVVKTLNKYHFLVRSPIENQYHDSVTLNFFSTKWEKKAMKGREEVFLYTMKEHTKSSVSLKPSPSLDIQACLASLSTYDIHTNVLRLYVPFPSHGVTNTGEGTAHDLFTTHTIHLTNPCPFWRCPAMQNANTWILRLVPSPIYVVSNNFIYVARLHIHLKVCT